MWLNYPTAEGVSDISDQYMLGYDLIVKPVLEKDATQ
jgi:alpha-glucosidase (family GH31 glycosyl hydrolase)